MICTAARAMPVAEVVEVAPQVASVETDAAARRSFMFANVLGLMVGRFGFDFGTFVAPHVAPIGSLHLQAMFMPSKDRH